MISLISSNIRLQKSSACCNISSTVISASLKVVPMFHVQSHRSKKITMSWSSQWVKGCVWIRTKSHYDMRVRVSQKRSPNLLATVIWCWAVSNHILHTEPRVSIDLSTHDLDMPARPSHHTGWQHFCQSQSVSYKNSSRNSFVYTYIYPPPPPHSSNQIFFGTSSHLEL